MFPFNLPSSFRDSLPERPYMLEAHGYAGFEEYTGSPTRWVWYRKRLKTVDGSHFVDATIRYELAIDDNPIGTEEENRNYFCNNVYLLIWAIEEDEDDEEEERHAVAAYDDSNNAGLPGLRRLARIELSPRTFQEFEEALKIFRS